MKREEAEEFTQTLALSVTCNWKQIAWAQRNGIPKALDLTTAAWVERLGGYVKLAGEERFFAAATLKAEGLSTRKIGEILGVDHETVRRDLAGANAPKRGEPPEDAGAHAPLDTMTGLVADNALRHEATRDERHAERRAARIALAREANAGNTSLEDEHPAPILYADPPWQYEHVKTDTRAIENQYPTLALEEIVALTVPATEDAVLFLWAPSPKLFEALHVVVAWGFTYRTCLVWVKDKIGMGYYARQQHELLLLATRGDLPVPKPADRPASVILAPRGPHSVKPAEVYDLIERMYPEFAGEWLELFQRGTPRPGWRRWGNQSAPA